MKKTLTDFKADNTTLQNSFDMIKQQYINNGFDPVLLNDIETIFKIGLLDPSLFPNIVVDNTSTCHDYISKWIKGYFDAYSNLPSKRLALPKGSCSDPAIQTIVQIATSSTPDTISKMAAHHNLFMSAENIQGNLLEEYINTEIRKFGWIWCNGNVLRAVDFCSADGSCLLQVKNKSNTENSSSSAIRTNTNIVKWYRLGTATRKGVKVPDYKWDVLNEFIDMHNITGISGNCNMCEQSYMNFLCKVTSNNPGIITHL